MYVSHLQYEGRFYRTLYTVTNAASLRAFSPLPPWLAAFRHGLANCGYQVFIALGEVPLAGSLGIYTGLTFCLQLPPGSG